MKAPPPDWHEAYLSYRYIPGKMDCLDFVVEIQRDIFGRVLEIPPRVLPPTVLAGDYQDGDIALFNDRHQNPHIGILMVKDDKVYLLHNNRVKCGASVEKFPQDVIPTLTLLNVYRPRD